MSCRIPSIGGLFTVSSTNKNLSFEVLVTPFNDDRIIGIRISIYHNRLIIGIAEICLLRTGYVILPQQ